MPEPILSFCIPTYNFGVFIGDTLESIVSQATDEVEIVILDGGSTDDTAQVVERYRDRFPRLRYVRRPVKGGIDRDMALAVEHARGEYCWLFGADDLLREGAIARVLDAIRSGDDVYLVETTLCTREMKPLFPQRNLEIREERTFDLSRTDERLRYFELAANTQAFFSFCGAVVFRRDRWSSAAADAVEPFIGSCWAHAARLFSLVPNGLRVHHIPGPLTLKRMENDSFSAQGPASRVRIGIEGYLRIADVFFDNSSAEAAHIRRCLRAEYTLVFMTGTMIDVVERRLAEDRKALVELFGRIYDSRFLIAAYRLMPRVGWRALGIARRIVKRFSR